jgi:hypothetical protein
MKLSHGIRNLIVLALCITLAGCSRRGARTSAFGEGTGRSDPKGVQYYEDAGVALDEHLTSLGFSAVSPPANTMEGGLLAQAQRDTWYQGPTRGLYIHVRQPTENAGGLFVHVVWNAQGTASYLDSVHEDAKSVQVQLTAWWQEYKRKNPRP